MGPVLFGRFWSFGQLSGAGRESQYFVKPAIKWNWSVYHDNATMGGSIPNAGPVGRPGHGVEPAARTATPNIHKARSREGVRHEASSVCVRRPSHRCPYLAWCSSGEGGRHRCAVGRFRTQHPAGDRERASPPCPGHTRAAANESKRKKYSPEYDGRKYGDQVAQMTSRRSRSQGRM